MQQKHIYNYNRQNIKQAKYNTRNAKHKNKIIKTNTRFTKIKIKSYQVGDHQKLQESCLLVRGPFLENYSQRGI